MLPSSPQKILLSWLKLVQDFQAIIVQENSDSAQIQSQWQNIQNYWQSQIMTRQYSDFSAAEQTWQIETHRYLRLLNTELLFWRSSQQIETKSERHLAIRNRLEAIIKLSQELLDYYEEKST